MLDIDIDIKREVEKIYAVYSVALNSSMSVYTDESDLWWGVLGDQIRLLLDKVDKSDV